MRTREASISGIARSALSDVEAAIKRSARQSRTRGKRWDFVAQNADLLRNKAFRSNEDIMELFDRRYEQYSDVPKVDEIFNALQVRNQWRKSLIEKRKCQHIAMKKDMMKSVVCKAMQSMKAAKQETNKSMAVLIDTLRCAPNLRTDDDCLMIKDWIIENCRKNSVLYKFLSKCDQEKSISICRGLYYQIFAAYEAIVKQGAEENAFYVILKGECSVFHNDMLGEDEIADPLYGGNEGIGQKQDSIRKGSDFGDDVLLRTEQRKTSIIASDGIVECLVCDQAHFRKCVQRHRDEEIKAMIESAQKSHLFKDCDAAYLQLLFKRFKKVSIDKNALLQIQNHRIQNVFFLLSGRCKEFVQIKDKNGRIRKEYICEFGGHCTVIGGFYAIYSKSLPLSSIVSMTECHILTISKEEFIKNLRKRTWKKIKSIGRKKHAFIKQRMQKFKSVLKDISNRFEMNENKPKTIPSPPYDRHGRWGRNEQICLDKMISCKGLKDKSSQKRKKKAKRKETKKLTQQPKLFSLNFSQTIDEHSADLDMYRMRNETEGIEEEYMPFVPYMNLKFNRATPRNTQAPKLDTSPKKRPITAPICLHSFRENVEMKDAKINVPSIQRIAIKIRAQSSPSRKRNYRFAAKSAVIGGLFDYKHSYEEMKEFTQRIQNERSSDNNKRPQTTQNVRLQDRKEGESEMSNVMGDMMTANFDTKYFDDDENEQIAYEQMMQSLKRKQEKRMQKERMLERNISSHYVTMKSPNYSLCSSSKRSRRKTGGKRRKTKRYTQTIKTTPNEIYGLLPSLKTKTLRRRQSSKGAFGRSNVIKTRRGKKRATRNYWDNKTTKVRVNTPGKYGKNEYEIQFGGLAGANIDFEISEWINYDRVLDEIRELKRRFKEHLIDEAELMRTQLMRSGTCPDLLVKYQTMDNPKVLHQYIKHFQLPVPVKKL